MKVLRLPPIPDATPEALNRHVVELNRRLDDVAQALDNAQARLKLTGDLDANGFRLINLGSPQEQDDAITESGMDPILEKLDEDFLIAVTSEGSEEGVGGPNRLFRRGTSRFRRLTDDAIAQSILDAVAQNAPPNIDPDTSDIGTVFDTPRFALEDHTHGAPDFLYLPGRTGSTNDPTISTDADGTITGSATAGFVLHLTADGTGTGVHIETNGQAFDRLIVGPNIDPTEVFLAGGLLQFACTSETAGGTRFGAVFAGAAEDDAPTFLGIRSQGTLASPTETLINNTLLQFLTAAYDSDDNLYVSPIILAFDADDNAGSGFVPGRMTIVTTDASGGLGVRLIMKNNGHIGINTGNDPSFMPPEWLTIVGNILLLDDSGTASELHFGTPNGNAVTTFVAQDQTADADIAYTLPDTQGAASTFLQNDGAGVLSWVTASGAGLIDGSGATDEIAFFSDADTITSDPNFTWDGTTFTVTGDAEITGKLTVGGAIDPTMVLLSGADKRFGATDVGAVYLAPFTDATSAVQVRKADNTTVVLNIDTTNAELELSGQLNWPAGLGAIVQVQGPTDQNLLIRSGTGRSLTLGPDGVEALLIAASGNVAVQAEAIAATRQLIVGNSDNTSVLSHALLAINAGGTSGGDAQARFAIPGGQTYSIGVDNSDSDTFKVSRSSSLGTNDYIRIDSAALVTLGGSLTTPSQLISTVATGTAPLAVTSTTLVTNLNADLLDGLDSTAFQPIDADLTEIAAVANVRGDLLITNSGPTWVRLGVGGANTVLHSDGTDPSWQALVDADIPNTLTLTNITGGTTFSADVIVGTTISGYNGATTVGAGVPYLVATVDLTAQTAAVATTTLYAVPASRAGLYRITWYLKVTTADPVSSTLGPITFTWTDATDATSTTCLGGGNTQAGAYSQTNSLANNVNAKITGSTIVWAAASSNIQYAIGYATNAGGVDMAYEFHAKVEALL